MIDLAANLPVRIVRDANAPRFGNAFQARRDVDAIAEDVVVVDDDITDMNPDAEFDPKLRRHAGISDRHFLLYDNGASRGIDRAAEFDQHAIAGGFDDTAV